MKNLRDLHQNVVGSTHKDETKPVFNRAVCYYIQTFFKYVRTSS